jgi:hypothetical protein
LETSLKIAWKGMLDKAPAIIAVAGAIALVLSYLYQVSYFVVRGSAFAIGELSIADLADHAGLAVSICALVSSSMVLSTIKSLRERAKHLETIQGLNLEQLKAEMAALQKTMKRLQKSVIFLIVGMSVLGLIVGSILGWYAIAVFIVFFPVLYAAAFYSLFWLSKYSSPAFDRRDVMIIGDIIFATVITISIAGYLGAIARDCPKQIEIDYAAGKHIGGELIGSLNRGVVLGEKGGVVSSLIPWAQIAKFSEQRCPAKPLRPGFYLPWGGGKNLWT